MIQIHKNIQLNTTNQKVIIQLENKEVELNYEQISKMILSCAKFIHSDRGIGHSKAKIEVAKNKRTLQFKKALKEFVNLKKLYTASAIAKELKAKYNKRNNQKYNISKFLVDMNKHVKVEYKNDLTNKSIKQIQKIKDCKHISVRYIRENR